MCVDPSARAPRPPRTGGLASSERLELVAEDGNRIAARLARTGEPGAPGVVVLPDVRGLHPYYEDLAEQLAEAGAHALAIDPYGRTAGPGYRDEAFDFAPHRERTTDDHLRTDVRAAAATLRERGASRVFVLGFCFGGRAALLQASQPGIDGVIGFYGWPARGDGSSPIEEARRGLLRAPVLALFGGADRGITPDQVEAYREALAASGVPHEVVVYPGAPHSFFDRAMTEHAEACADAWRRVLAFLGVG
ncbi:MAG TPA: dienelactone hydrolase family protein [Actinomycetota bacterium]|nr:dienelactone hydrolase family protein [Actinomycetota bacterium]